MPKAFLSSLIQKIWTVLLLLIFATLSGCAIRLDVLETLSSKTKLAPDEGILVVRVINATDYPLPLNHISIAPENLHESEKIKVQQLASLRLNIEDTSVFASPVQSGNYALSSVGAFHSRGDLIWSHFASANAKFGTFNVEPGKVTDLGTIIYYQKPQEDTYSQMLVRMPKHQTGEVLRKYFPFYQFEYDSVLTWHDDGLDEQRETDFLSIAQNPIVFENAYRAPDGSLYFLGKLGVFLIRNSYGDWFMDAVDTNFNLNTIAQNKVGDLIVGGEEGKLFLKRRGGDWQDISLAHDVQIVELLFHDEKHVDLITKSGPLVTINRGNINQTIEWQEMNRFTAHAGWKVIEQTEEERLDAIQEAEKNNKKPPREIASVSLTKSNIEQYITVRSMTNIRNRYFDNGRVERFAYDPDSWKIFEPNSDSEVSMTLQAGKIELGVTEVNFWSWTPAFARYDRSNNSWQKLRKMLRVCENGKSTLKLNCPAKVEGLPTKKARINRFEFLSVPVFTSETDAIAVVNFSKVNAWNGKRTDDIKILKTTDGGKGWLDTGNSTPTEFCFTLVREVFDRLLVYCNGATGDFYESFDEGKTWEHVRQQLNF